MDKKKIVELLGAIFVAVIFLSSYASFANQSPSSTSSTSTALATYYAVGYANAVIQRYNNVLYIQANCAKAAENVTLNALNLAVVGLENNGSVLSSSATTGGLSVDPGTFDSLQIYDYAYGRLNASQRECTLFGTAAAVALPSVINMSVQSQKISVSVPAGSASQQVYLNLTQNMSDKIRLRVSALITQNGTVQGNVAISGA